MAELLKGAEVVAALTEELTNRINELKGKGVTPTIHILRVGEREDDLAYERGVLKYCEKIGMGIKKTLLPADCKKEELLDAIRAINADEGSHGCLMFRPLPDKEMEAEACALLDPAKDVDCITAGSLASVFSGVGAGYPPCTAQACIEILDHYGYDLTGKNVTVIGRSLVIGKPVSMLLQQKNATVTMCHTKTKNMAEICSKAEILVVAAGRAGVVTREYTNPDQVVIDVGINFNQEGKMCGDVDFADVEPGVAAITPVPGGVGRVTTAVLAKHVVEAAEKQ